MKRIFEAAAAAMLGVMTLGTTLPAYAGSDITVEQFEAAFRDNYTGYYYRNLTNMEKFTSALEDDYTPERYGAIMDRSRFAILRNDVSESNTTPNADLLAATAAAKATKR